MGVAANAPPPCRVEARGRASETAGKKFNWGLYFFFLAPVSSGFRSKLGLSEDRNMKVHEVY